MVPLGLSQAATVRVGLAYGRADTAAITRAGWTAFLIGTGFMTLAALIMLGFPHLLVAAFLNENDPGNAQVVRLAIGFIGIAALFQIVDGAQAVGAGMLRGLQDTKVPMAYAAFGYWVVGLGVAVGLGFGLDLAGIGVWIGLAVGLAVVSVLMIARWMRRGRLGLLPA